MFGITAFVPKLSQLFSHTFREKPKKIKGSSGEGPSKKQKVDATETVFIKRTMHFTRFKEALEKKWGGIPEKEMKRVPPVFFMLQGH